MESSSAPTVSPGSTLTRALCALMLVLMLVAGAYGVTMALRYFRQIGV